MMHGHGKSDSSIVLAKPPNEAGPEAKEAVEGRGLAKGKTPKRNMSRTQSRMSMFNALERIRRAVMKDGSERCYHSYSSASIGVITQSKSRMQ
jgi:RNA-directed DNA polymerase